MKHLHCAIPKVVSAIELNPPEVLHTERRSTDNQCTKGLVLPEWDPPPVAPVDEHHAADYILLSVCSGQIGCWLQGDVRCRGLLVVVQRPLVAQVQEPLLLHDAVEWTTAAAD